ncbi:hydrolase [Mycobacterium phage Ukulele]|nr:hydrolase [Mycobacterium phage Ukulele]
MATLIDYTQIAIPDDPAKLGLTYIAGPMTLVGPPTWNYPASMTWRIASGGGHSGRLAPRAASRLRGHPVGLVPAPRPHPAGEVLAHRDAE